MRWPRNPLTKPRTGRPQPSGWCKHNHGCVDTGWYEVDGGLVRQCSCGHVTTVRPLSPGWVQALQSGDARASDDFDGARE